MESHQEIYISISEVGICRFMAKVTAIEEIENNDATLYPEISAQIKRPVIVRFRYAVERLNYPIYDSNAQVEINLPWQRYYIPKNCPMFFLSGFDKNDVVVYGPIVNNDNWDSLYIAHDYILNVQTVELIQIHNGCCPVNNTIDELMHDQEPINLLENPNNSSTSNNSEKVDDLTKYLPVDEQNNQTIYAQLFEIPTEQFVPLDNKTQKCIDPKFCQFCERKFYDEAMLKKHEKMHTGDKPYVCDFCRRGFALSDHLRTHERTHTGEKPHQCDQYLKAFARSDELTGHKKVHNK